MAIWDLDLSTQHSTMEAARKGGIAAFVFCALAILGGAIFGARAGFGSFDGIAAMIGAGGEAAVALVAGLRLRAGQGAYWGALSVALLVVEIAAKLISLRVAGVAVQIFVLIYLVNGVRAAWTLRSGQFAEGHDAEVFS